MPVTPTLQELQTAKSLLATPGTTIEQLPPDVVSFLREQMTARIKTLTGPKFSPEEQQTLAALKTNFDRTATLLAHGLSWETVEASLAADKEAIGILGDLLARGGQPTVTADKNGKIRWNESASNVPLADFKGIPMSNLAYDGVGQAKARREQNCRGNALESARRIHPRLRLTSKAESEKLAQAGLVKDNQSFPWVYTPDSERGDKNDQFGGLAWVGCDGLVVRSFAYACVGDRGARFSIEVFNCF